MRVELPQPTCKCPEDFFSIVRERRSRRNFLESPLNQQELSDTLYYTCGSTGEFHFHRASPSAGALHAIDVLVMVGDVIGVEAGLYKYDHKCHVLDLICEGDSREALSKACLGQKFVAAAPLSLVFSVDEETIAKRYHDRAKRYAALDCGHYGQNVYLICEVLELATCGVGAFNDAEVSECLELPANRAPYYIFPIGRRTR